MKTFITSMAVAMLLAVTANADVIHSTDYEADGAATGVGFGVGQVPSSVDFTDGGGDLIGFSANGNPLTSGDALGISDANPNSGTYSYAVDAGQTAGSGNGWGASWSGISSDSANSSGGFDTQANVMAAGSGSYINYVEGATFTVSAMVATDASNPLTGGGTAAPRLEFFNAAGAELFRNQSAQVNATTISDTYQLLTHSYTLSAADEAAGIVRVAAILGTDGMGDGGSGLVLYDDFTFEVSSANVVTLTAVPEPSTAGLLIAGLMGLCGVRRRKS
jgi:hypothetical protein